MLSRDRFIFLALCLSLALHVTALLVADAAVRYAQVWTAGRHHSEVSMVLRLAPPHDPIVDEEMGDRAGTGTGSEASDGLTPLEAKQADQDQPLLSRDSQTPGRVSDAPSPLNGPPGQRGRGGQRGGAAAQAAVSAEPASPPTAPTAIAEAQAPAPSPPTPEAARPKIAMDDASKPSTPTPPSLKKPVQVASAAHGSEERAAAVEPDQPALPADPLATIYLRSPNPAESKPNLSTPPAQSRAAADDVKPAPAPPVQVAIATPALPEVKVHPSPAVEPPAPAQASSQSRAPVQVATGDGLAPGQASHANPAQQSESDSDAFTKLGVAVFHNGKLSVRSGRKVRTVRPQLLVPGILDVIGVQNPTVILKINIDPTGKVAFVDVLQSSGSNDIDQPVVVAVYDWWFEPARDRTGKPISDAIVFSISFR